MERIFLILLLGVSIILVAIRCDKNPSEPKPTNGAIDGSVKSVLPGSSSAIYPAYIFGDDSLLATSDKDGNYSIAGMEEGTCELTCSALNYRDSTEKVQVLGGQTITHNFYLMPDASTGRVNGEFQDVNLYNQNLLTNPSLAGWDAKRIFDDATGATVQAKTYGYDIPDRKLFLGDSLVAISDWWGQYWFKIQCGTYPITGSCEGYHDSTLVIKVLPDTKVYLNFFLRRE